MREPLETKEVSIARARFKIDFPADFQLVAAMNPCPCGWIGHPVKKCNCRVDQIERYQGRLSGPLLDRIDLAITITESEQNWMDLEVGECSATVRARVAKVRLVQMERQNCVNAQLPASLIDKMCPMTTQAQQLLAKVVQFERMSARSIQIVRRVARSCADLSGCLSIDVPHLAEAFQYRLRQPRARS